ncbi:hypothetical protein P168DRAFT_323826 [Aspergillus campestris IBT 28561]|uniref:Glycine zipper 2TM domain-containing protein n=1 Tax=Aspergillus campestris (strain IBT 28561) TaxID=1392248 RepID=A0A2I1DFV2_ASPC2|nr:uncharacterized protein P168DRAFT_323826 [Aspergillus campestris IBT 28561]PKY08755.1 hypothetical protein P168DRAFT_323826 [Aspergillus campestris IBT 28561]
MADPYQQYTNPHPQYMQQPAPPPPPLPAESEAAYYAPPDSLYQNPPYDYETQYSYGQHVPPDHGSNYDVSQMPRYQPPIPPPAQSQSDNFLSPASAAEYHPQEYYDSGRLSPNYEAVAVGKMGSNADYYNRHPAENLSGNSPHPSQRSDLPEGPGGEKDGGADGSGDERSVGGALVGGATGYYLGHKKGHGLLGAVGGALLGNFIGDRLEGDDGKGEHHGGRHGHGHGHGHRHGRRRHHHHHGHHGHSHGHSHSHSHSHSHHRSRSRHDTSSTSYSGSS